jgi:hypothetical protein
MFVSFKFDACCVRGEKSRRHDLSGKCDLEEYTYTTAQMTYTSFYKLCLRGKM